MSCTEEGKYLPHLLKKNEMPNKGPGFIPLILTTKLSIT